ncbi:hypothetical protein MJO29_009119 [Puccinia striiformis f. sp. tritici]|uniref:hypothetical protein n=1 Tax=Puccinia striiformis f. sp. tritici TaxID=168172 RepID=UPI0020074588|nr:hypothetical protein Pst134EA_017923 [Puccinia striiformis f. sp. tritici]KAH9461628.1 hypothetical protein Pst134EA_017923 [Puccinia striiformis f. sp. tritici]KAI7950445.1 hypothetical protein MJO29_009119 [Puccinia striiformis f. sp. tritici]
MQFPNLSHVLLVVVLHPIVAGATADKTYFACPLAGYCGFKDKGTTPTTYAFGPASQPVGTWQLTCDKSQLPFGPVINVCCDNLAVSLVSRKPDDPLIVSENDFITKFACREVPNSI